MSAVVRSRPDLCAAAQRRDGPGRDSPHRNPRPFAAPASLLEGARTVGDRFADLADAFDQAQIPEAVECEIVIAILAGSAPCCRLISGHARWQALSERNRL
jgi:hypothetical protein